MSRYELGAIVQRLSGPRKITPVPLLFSGLIFLGGCSEAPRPTEPTQPPATSPAPAPQAITHAGEEPFREISSRIPEFAGYFLEGDALVGLVTDLGRDAAVGAALQPVRNRQGIADQVARVDIRLAQYSYSQLSDWRDRLVDEVFQLDDVSLLDLDEKQNRVVIGLDDGSGRAAVRETLTELGIPPAAIIIEVTGRTVPDVGVTTPLVEPAAFRRGHTLRNFRRPLEGGLQVQFAGQGVCTLGVLARRGFPLRTVLITASHCSPSTMHPDNGAIYQHVATGGGQWVGNEVHDPNHFYCRLFTHGCRYSDATMTAVTGFTAWNMGYIARTTNRVTGWGNNGSVVISTSNPRMEIVASVDYTASGQRVEKIGRSSGWTYGEVDRTCFRSRGTDGRVRICSFDARYYSRGGDSGAPVFSWGGGNTVTLHGIHWGSNRTRQRAVYSPLGGLRLDLGTFTFGALPSTPPPPTANISGPHEMTPGSLCQWNGSASGGTPPYSYSWSGILSGSGSSIMGSPSRSGVLKLRVTDAASQQDTHNRYVEVTSSAPDCVGGPR